MRREKRHFRIAHLPSRRMGDSAWFALALITYAVQEFGISHLSLEGAESEWRRFLFLGTTLVVAAAALHFRRYVGAWLIAAGILLNLLPMLAHGGLMPVAYETVSTSGAFPEITESGIGRQAENSKDIVLWRDDIRFEALSDRYFVEIPGYGPNIFSLGDVVAGVGLVLAAAQIIRGVVVRPREDKPALPAPGAGN